MARRTERWSWVRNKREALIGAFHGHGNSVLYLEKICAYFYRGPPGVELQLKR